tara:strand:+ start:717 stop:971 length:255 start_codon:yes stop_codon:yes gene_type:complete
MAAGNIAVRIPSSDATDHKFSVNRHDFSLYPDLVSDRRRGQMPNIHPHSACFPVTAYFGGGLIAQSGKTWRRQNVDARITERFG